MHPCLTITSLQLNYYSSCEFTYRDRRWDSSADIFFGLSGSLPFYHWAACVLAEKF